MAARIDLNADVGEGFGAWSMGADEALVEHVTSVNVACGFHAGDPCGHRPHRGACRSRRRGDRRSPGYFDLRGFGRREMQLPASEVEADVRLPGRRASGIRARARRAAHPRQAARGALQPGGRRRGARAGHRTRGGARRPRARDGGPRRLARHAGCRRGRRPALRRRGLRRPGLRREGATACRARSRER